MPLSSIQSLKRSDRPRHTLARRGVQLLSLALIVQLGLVAALSYLHDRAEQYAVRAGNARDLSRAMALFTAKDYSTIARVNNALESNPALVKDAIMDAQEAVAAGRRLKEIKRDDAPFCNEVQHVMDALVNMVNLAQYLTTAPETQLPANSDSRKQLLQKLNGYRHQAENPLMRVGEMQRWDQFKQPEFWARDRERSVAIVIAGTIFDVVFILLAGVLFLHYVVARINTIIDNSYRLAAQLPLNPRITGADEFAMVDDSFHRMADSLAEYSREQRAMIENARDIICSLDSKGTFTDVSKASLAVLGYTPEELIGNRLVNFVPKNDADEVWSQLKTIVEGGAERPFELTFVKKNNAASDILWSAIWSGTDKKMFCVAHDITERKAAERLRQEVVQMVSHDLRTPLSTILGFHGMLEKGMLGELTEKGQKLAGISKHSAERMITLINDLLEIERMEEGALELNKTEAALYSVLEQSAQAVSQMAAKNGVIVQLLTTDLIVFADVDRLVQILVNLLTNAVKFSPSGGTVRLSAVRIPGSVLIQVADQGRGIPAHMLGSIFDRFKQVSTSDATEKGGSGLGLAICKALVELHGGEITVESDEGKGSIFSIRIPCEVASASQQELSQQKRA